MPLDDIIYSSPIKRKSIKATPTICRFCNRKFLDKYYKGEKVHKVRCPHCSMINAEIDVEDYVQKIWEQAFRHDIGTYGALGGIHRTGKFRDMIRDAFNLQTEEEVDLKLKQFEYNVKMEQYKIKIEKERRERMIKIKRKGEKERTL